MNQEKKQFGNKQNGGGDFDTAPYALGQNNWVNAENVRTLTTDSGVTEVLESIGSTELIQNLNTPIFGDIIPLGKAIDEARNRIIYFHYNSLSLHAIYCYDLNYKIVYLMATDSQITGGLGFDKYHPIHSARVINGCVYWTDYLNQQRRMDIDAGIKMNNPSYATTVLPYSPPLTQSVISLIRRQPGLPPNEIKIYQTSPAINNNFIAKEAFLFCYRYVYRNFEISTLSGLSLLANFNSDTDKFNRIDISIPNNEVIDQDVIQIDLVAVYLQSDQYFIINSWRTVVPADAAAIASHNAGTSSLTYSFYNDKLGIALDSAYSVKPFDSIPIISETLEVAKNRLHLGNNVSGYTTPIETSLAIVPVIVTVSGGAISSVVGQWQLLKYTSFLGPHGTGPFSYYIIQTTYPLGPLAPHPFYYYSYTATVVPPYPATILESDLTFIGFDSTQASVFLNGSGFVAFITLTPQGASSVINLGTPSVSSVIGKYFKSDASYQVAIEFLDNAGRKCGILTHTDLIMYAPDSGLGSDQYVQVVNWTLSNILALAEIPDFAYYYSINITKCLRTRFFVQCIGTVIYADKNPTTNEYTFTTSVYNSNLAGVAIDLTFLQSNSMGYLFNEGDIAKLYVNGNPYSLVIIAQVAQYIICQLQNVGALSAVVAKYELYTPYKPSVNEPFFEVSQIYPVANPGQNMRQYSVTSGAIGGDIYLFNRHNSTSNYISEAMSPNDKFYKLWFTDAGRPNFIDYIGQTIKKSSGSFSNTFIPGTKNNGLSTFDALDTYDIYPECGPLRKLQLTSKVEGQQGGVMLAICEEETASMYLGESQVLSTNSDAFIAQATNVVGTINVLKGNFGTTDPTSVFEFRGNVFFFNASNGKVIQYSGNGLFPISNYKMTRFWKLWSLKYLSMTKQEIEVFGSRPYVYTCVDPHNWELLISIPKLSNDPPKGYLPDYPEIIYPFDILDYQAKTIVFKLSAEPNHWSGAYNYPADEFAVIQNSVYGFKGSQLYMHNSIESYCNIYGVQYKARIMFVGNQVPNRPKVFNNISIEGNMRPSLTYFRTEPGFNSFEQYDLPEQASDLMDFDFEMKEGNLYAALYRNKLQPTATGMNLDGLLTGQKMRALTLLILMEFNVTTNSLELRFVNLNYQVSAGHTT